MTDYEEVIERAIGTSGFVQWLLLIGCHNLTIIGAWSMIMMSFAGAEPSWWSEMTMHNTTSGNKTLIKLEKICPTNPNQTLMYGKEIITIVSEWDLVCSRDWIPDFITTLQMIGAFLGAFLVGQTAELVGRKKSLIAFFIGVLIFNLVAAFSNSWQLFATCRFFIGLGLGGVLVLIYVLPMEYLTKRWRTVVAVIPFWSFGVMLFGLLFKFVKDWRKISIITAASGLPFLVILFFLPESCRWLFIKNRSEEGKAILTKLARWNRRESPDLKLLDSVLTSDINKEAASKKYTYLDLLRYRELYLRNAVFTLQWVSVGLVYYGLTFGVSNLSGNTSLNLVLAGLTEASSMLVLWLISRLLGRKYSTMLCFGVCGIMSLSITITFFAASTSDFNKVYNILALIARLGLAAAWQAIIAYTNENYPTVVRSVGFSLAVIFGRIGSILAPQVNYLHKVSNHIPYTIYGVLAILSALACIFLKDTYETPLEDYLQDNRTNKVNVQKVEMAQMGDQIS